MGGKEETRNLKGTWNQAILSFLIPILLVMGFRWAFIEPFVIPSGSMVPNLLINDHILVNKSSYGLRVPFVDRWLAQWKQPQRGDIVVFKYPENPDIHYVKRLIGLPGEEVTVLNGRVEINGRNFEHTPFESSANEKEFSYFTENNGRISYVVRFLYSEAHGEPQVFKIPEGHFFFMGDNRDQSSDSRFWGPVAGHFVVGRAWLIWLSCEGTLPTMTFVCDPSQLRWNRFFKTLQ